MFMVSASLPQPSGKWYRHDRAEESDMDRRSQWGLLHETAAGTPMGTLLRRFWQPVALSSSVAKGGARPLRVMGEELTLYRGDSGAAHLVGGRCAHRGTVTHT